MKKILILEDNKEVAFLYAKLLKAHGYETTLAFDGLEALELLKKFEPNLILMDVNMPKLSGVGFYQEICDSQNCPKYPLLVITGRVDLELTFKHLPVSGVMLKPVDRTKLLNKVEEILSQSKLTPTA